MLKIAIVLWVILAGTLAGMAIMVVLATPALSAEAMRYIPVAAVIGAVVAAPLSAVIAKRILALNAPRA